MKPTVLEISCTALATLVARGRNVLFVLAATVLGAATHSWSVAVVAVILYAAILALQVRNVSLWRDVLTELRRRQCPLPDEDTVADEIAGRCVARIRAAREERTWALACSPGPPPAEALALVDLAAELEEVAVAHVWSLHQLGRCQDHATFREGDHPLLASQDSITPDPEWTEAIAARRLADGEALAALRAQLRVRLEASTDLLTMVPRRLALIGMHRRPDVTRDDDRTIGERLLDALNASASQTETAPDVELLGIEPPRSPEARAAAQSAVEKRTC